MDGEWIGIPTSLAERVEAASDSLGVSETEFLVAAVEAKLDELDDAEDAEPPGPITNAPPTPEGDVPPRDEFYSDEVARLVAEEPDGE